MLRPSKLPDQHISSSSTLSLSEFGKEITVVLSNYFGKVHPPLPFFGLALPFAPLCSLNRRCVPPLCCSREPRDVLFARDFFVHVRTRRPRESAPRAPRFFSRIDAGFPSSVYAVSRGSAVFSSENFPSVPFKTLTSARRDWGILPRSASSFFRHS